MATTSIRQQLKEARMLIENAMKNPDVQQKLQEMGYIPENLQKGKELLERAMMQQQLKRDLYGDQYEATDTVTDDYQALRLIFKDHITLAAMAFRGKRGVQARLGIDQPMARSRAAWTAQAFNFYTKAVEYQKQLGRFGITKAELEQSLAAIEAFVDLQDQHMDKMGAAQRSTQQQKQALQELRNWVKGFKAIVKAAVGDDVHLLEGLGIVVPSK